MDYLEFERVRREHDQRAVKPYPTWRRWLLRLRCSLGIR